MGEKMGMSFQSLGSHFNHFISNRTVFDPSSMSFSSSSPSTSSSASLSENESKINLLSTSSSELVLGPQSEDFTKDLSCTLCLEWFKDPVILPCGHNYCKSCIEGIWVKMVVCSCPECQAEFPNRQYIANSVLGKVVERIQAFHMERFQQKCREHSEPLTLFWKMDGKLACFLCRDSQKPEDQSSQFLLLSEAVQLYVEHLISARTQVESTLQELKTVKNAQQEKISCHKENKMLLQQNISLQCLKLHQFLHSRERRLMNELQEEGKTYLQEMEANLNILQEKCHQAKETLLRIQSRLYQHNFISFLTDVICALCSLEKNISTLSKGHMVSQELNLGQLKGPVQYTLWKGMKSILNPGLSSITLDPNTAHPNLILSEDLTCVRHDNTKQMLPDTPERFDSSVAVLGSEGFTSGKHYWEVEVKNKTKWTLGVVKESINRKGNNTLTPMDGYWLIKLRNRNELKALDRLTTSLTLNTNLSKVGVYLDYEGGQVSFYDANRMSHIYTFMDTFTGETYPCFCPCLNDSGENSEPLKIFSKRDQI
ncbi:PREDICTED: E3 ubiquitin-protein ligase TRIM69 isoform X2 [Crocodylus porosus]|uniref:E3 ubiquitin-protein ligase TRIM69 isoform X2 n=1 Tax=Crocodylus porosus TaxID=8502 RepID=UPI00093DA7CB|nr:PREDICTED: E3 ubiquitin-protein ligase TRIM69 isoform X2 [Crocodylus porosus]